MENGAYQGEPPPESSLSNEKGSFESKILDVIKEPWFIGTIGTLVWLFLFVFVVLLCCRRARKRRQQRRLYHDSARGMGRIEFSYFLFPNGLIWKIWQKWSLFGPFLREVPYIFLSWNINWWPEYLFPALDFLECPELRIYFWNCRTVRSRDGHVLKHNGLIVRRSLVSPHDGYIELCLSSSH